MGKTLKNTAVKQFENYHRGTRGPVVQEEFADENLILIDFLKSACEDMKKLKDIVMIFASNYLKILS